MREDSNSAASGSVHLDPSLQKRWDAGHTSVKQDSGWIEHCPAKSMNPSCFVDGDFDATHGTSARVVARVLTRCASRISGIRRDTEKFPPGNGPDIFCRVFSALFGYAQGRLRSRALTENRSRREFQPPVKSIRGGNTERRPTAFAILQIKETQNTGVDPNGWKNRYSTRKCCSNSCDYGIPTT